MIFRHYKLFLYLLITAVVILGIFLVESIYTIRANNNETARVLSLASEADTAKARAQFIRAMRLEAAEDIEAFENLVISEEKFISLIETIEGAGSALGLTVDVASVSKSEDKKSAEPGMIRVIVEARGPWSGIYPFLLAVESMPYKVVVEETTFTKESSRWHAKIILMLNSFK